jgi:hypothetical protein
MDSEDKSVGGGSGVEVPTLPVVVSLYHVGGSDQLGCKYM